ncbi:hypothetical protein ILUMI_01949 [Ignelater luminosus]|uniref:Reverse transcriptase domain-containing protein n=1 Tax=Ignelater luminosus TaxID=2038154 RepID=A0A8K0DJ80_IGNLU|nr:hypothetical protein ILUMI_01949 [Ignelater luminosus]
MIIYVEGTKKPQDCEAYQTERKKVKKWVREEKEKSWIEFVEKMNAAYNQNQKLFFATLRNARNEKTTTLRNMKGDTGEIIIEEEKVIEKWRQIFVNLLEGKEEETMQTLVGYNQEGIGYEQQTQEVAITEGEMIDTINKTKAGKAPRMDNITTEIIKAGKNKVMKTLVTLMNTVLNTGIAPSDWQTRIIVPI